MRNIKNYKTGSNIAKRGVMSSQLTLTAAKSLIGQTFIIEECLNSMCILKSCKFL